MNKGFSTVDWIVLTIYLIAVVLIGGSFYGKHKNVKDYLIAGRRMSWFPIAISIIATDLSAISYMGIPALVYKHDLKYMLSAFLFPFQMGLVIVLFVPLLYRLNIYTAYQYLEHRFNTTTRLLASFLFLGGRGAWLATMTFATSVVLSEITGINTYLAIVICGISTTLYTFLGGMEAVIWTDFMQFFVLLGGAVAIAIFIVLAYGWDVSRIWDVATATGHTTMFDFSLDPSREYTFWGLLIGLLVYQLSTYGTDQINVQRYFATKNLKQTIWAAAGSALILLPVLLLLYGIGIGFTAFYHDHPGMRDSLSGPDRVMPHFTVYVLPAGLRGLVIAAIFAATMSSMSSGINSLATSTIKDFLEKVSQNIVARELYWARLISAFWGLTATAGATLMVDLKLTILERFNSIYQFFAGPLVGIFLLGILTRRASAWPVCAGAIVGFLVTVIVAQSTIVHWLWYAPVGCLVTLVVGYLGSLFVPQQRSDEIRRFTLLGSRQVSIDSK